MGNHGGVFAVDRGIFDHPAFLPEPYTQREAWLWMIGQAAWKPRTVRVGNAVISLGRGQLAFSERFMAQKWKWSKSKVHRFLIRLETEAMAVHDSDQETNRITICNYEKYAFNGTAREPLSEPQTGPAADQQRTKEKELKEGTKKEKDKRASRLPDDWQPSGELQAYAVECLGTSRVQLVTENFRDYWKAAAGSNAVKRDWDAAYRMWVRREGSGPPGGTRNAPPAGGRSTGQTAFRNMFSQDHQQ